MSKSKINSLYTSRYEQVTSNLNSPLCRLTPSNTSFKLSTIIPGSAALPTMVCVLPLPVAPYANTVPLCPDNTPGINSLAVLS